MDPAFVKYHTDQWNVRMSTADHNCVITQKVKKILSKSTMEAVTCVVENFLFRLVGICLCDSTIIEIMSNCNGLSNSHCTNMIQIIFILYSSGS